MSKLFLIISILFISFLTLNFTALNFDNGQREQERKIELIAKFYTSFDKSKKSKLIVTDSAKYKWTIALCRYQGEKIMGYYYQKDSLFLSHADTSKSEHGNKLYTLYLNDKESYYDYKLKTQPIGQIIVKETWNIIEADSNTLNVIKVLNEKDGKFYTTKSVSQLFIMYKEKESIENDNGWVYGIVDIEKGSDDAKILSNGKLSNCISCHKETKYDRMFGRY
jgi:hypothetical protein